MSDVLAGDVLTADVLILGGYGNFGKRIAAALVAKGISVVIAGRSQDKAAALAQQLGPLASAASFDVYVGLAQQLAILKPKITINICGPFQNSDYRVAEACIAHGVHYIDLADGRAFASGINALNTKAKQAGVTVVSGASTVPGLSSAVLEHYKHEFAQIESLKFGISPGQQAERGLATTKGIMSYVGKPLKPFPSIRAKMYGWQDIYRQDYPQLGKRWMANCDIPDFDLLPKAYGIKRIQFSAGLELSIMHLGLWGISWLVRLGVPLNLPKLAGPLLAISDWFNGLGSPDGGMHVIMTGTKADDGAPVMGEKQPDQAWTRKWFIIAKDGHGPHIPTIPAILLAERLAKGHAMKAGAYPCVGLVSLKDYLKELEAFSITTYEV